MNLLWSIFLLTAQILTTTYLCAYSAVVMVPPTYFGYNLETSSSNGFQKKVDSFDPLEIRQKAFQEFNQFVEVLRKNDILVYVIDCEEKSSSPDSVFPNNWFSHHPETSLLILYPIMAPNRRQERNEFVVNELKKTLKIKNVIDLSDREKVDIFLEGTGSIVFDFENKKAYACLSPRTNKELFESLCHFLGIEGIFFEAYDSNQVPIYHTNVMLSVGKKLVVICLEAITDQQQKEKLIDAFERNGKTIISISQDQMNNFCGNVFEVTNRKKEQILVMSQRAYLSFNQSQIKSIEKFAKIVYSPLNTIETVGGGSARCMLGGVFVD